MKSRGWCFTANIPDEEIDFDLEEGVQEADYMIYQLEKKGHLHLQGYIYYKGPRALEGVKAHLLKWTNINCHLERARGSPEQNKTYCTKAETRIDGPWEMGDLPKQGERADLIGAAKDAAEGASMEELGEKYGSSMVRYGKHIRETALALRNKGSWLPKPQARRTTRPMQVTIHWGSTGTGKTTDAEEDTDVTLASQTDHKRMFDKYHGEKRVLIDEFSPGHMHITKLLNLLSGKETEVEQFGAPNIPWLA